MAHSTRRKFLQHSALAGLAMSTAVYSQAATKEKYRVGIIGCTGKGDYGHGLDRVWSGVARTEVVAVADENPAGLESAKMTTGAKRGYADYRKMLANEDLDIVAVAPRLDLHRDMVLACAEHGRHVYMEKPFVRDLEQADDVVQACEKNGIKLSIAHINRFSPIRMMCKKLVEDGEIGEILEIRSRGKEDSRRGGG
ncbi:MAG: Gfo/Idh/MocA family oxidoreductase, partial [Planctomycetes bacterium]|nr:Gfo/Idh/MocA family oxidoreductase [Planctomycetota bacterium]